ncbi:MAG: mannose-1-phosphate guanyltransferase [Watsoniomyces obsoletus]|nr:MAG: mannose-1-phosphate guanyltransferase [Watsoniomyces obsoletus]
MAVFQHWEEFENELDLIIAESFTTTMLRQLRRRSNVDYSLPGIDDELDVSDDEGRSRTRGTDSMSVEEVRQHLDLTESTWAQLRNEALTWMTADNSRRAEDCVARGMISGPNAEERRAGFRTAIERCALEFLEEGGRGEAYFGHEARRSNRAFGLRLMWPEDRDRFLDLIIRVIRMMVGIQRRRQAAGGEGPQGENVAELGYGGGGGPSTTMNDQSSNDEGAAMSSSATPDAEMTDVPRLVLRPRRRATMLSDSDEEAGVKPEPSSDAAPPTPPGWLPVWHLTLHIYLFSSADAALGAPSSSSGSSNDGGPRRRPGNFGKPLFSREVTNTRMCSTYDYLVLHIRDYYRRATAVRERSSNSSTRSSSRPSSSRIAATTGTGESELRELSIRGHLPGSMSIIHDDRSYWEALETVREAEWMDDKLTLVVFV